MVKRDVIPCPFDGGSCVFNERWEPDFWKETIVGQNENNTLFGEFLANVSVEVLYPPTPTSSMEEDDHRSRRRGFGKNHVEFLAFVGTIRQIDGMFELSWLRV